MKKKLVYWIWWLTLLTWGSIFAGQSIAQTITVGTVAVSSCAAAGSGVSVPFSVSGTFGPTNQFTVQIINTATSYTGIAGVLSTTVGGTISATIPANIPVGSGYVIRVVSSSPARISGNTSGAFGILPPAPAVGTASPASGPVCQNTAVSLAATGSSIRWYSGAGTFLSAANPYSPPTAQAGSSSYQASQTVGGCEGPRGTVVVTVTAKSTQPGANPPAYCQGVPGQSVTASVSGSNLKWYISANVPAPNNTPDPVLVSSAGQRTYYVTQTTNGCESDLLTFFVTVNPKPNAPTASSPTVCQNSAAQTLSASGQPGATLQWYNASDALLVNNGAAPSPATTTPGLTTFKVDQTALGCRSDKATVTFTVRTAPAAPTPVSVSYCEAARPASLTPPAGNIQWFGNAAGTQGISQPAPPSAANTYTYSVRILDINSCQSNPSAYVVRVAVSPGLPTLTANDLSRCQGETVRALTATGGSGNGLNWFDGAGAALPGAPQPPTATANTQTYFVSQTTPDGCVGARATATVTIKPTPATPAANSPVVFCQNYGAPQLRAIPSGGASLQWYGQNATGGSATGTATTPANNASGTFNYYVSQILNGCESPTRTKIDVVVKRTPGAPNVVTPVVFCQNSSAPILNATPENGAALLWYGTNATGGTGGSNAPNPPNNIATSYSYYASQSLDECESQQRAKIDVTVKRTPGAPAVTPVVFCQFTNAPTLAATGENSSTLRWYGQNATGGNAAGNAPGLPNDVAGSFSFYVSQSVNDCESPRAGLAVRVKAKPAAPGTSALTYCLIQPDQPAQSVGPLTASGGNGAVLKWFNADGNAFQSAPTPPVNQVQAINFQVSQSIEDCESDRATLRVTVQTAATPGVSSSLVAYCQTTQSVPLTATSDTGGSLRWVDPSGVITNNAPTPITLNATKPGGEFFYVFQVGSNGCYSARNTIRLVVNSTPTLSLLGSTTLNLGLKANLQLRFTGVPPYSYVLTDGTNVVDSGVAPDTLATVAVMPARTTTYQVASVTNICGKGLPGNPATATVSVAVPTILTGTLASSALCTGANFSVPFSVAGILNDGNVFQVQVADTLSKAFVPVSATTTSTGPIVATLPASLTAGYYFVRVTGSNPGIAVAGRNSPVVLLVRGLPTARLSGSQDVYQGSSAKLSVAFTGDSPWTFVWADSTARNPVSTAANPHLIDVTPARTRSYSLISVANNCGNGTVSGTATLTILPLLAVDDPLSESVNVYPVPTGATLTVEIDRNLLTAPATLQLTDITGRATLDRTTQDRRTDLDLSQQPAGLYLLRVRVGEQTTVRRVLKL